MSKIVMANIKMPISVENGKLQPMSEYIKITVEKCDELPEKNQDNDGSLMSQIDKILSQQNQDSEPPSHDPEPEHTPKSIIVSLDEIQNNRPTKTRQNMSFKNKYHRSISKYTMKNRSNSSTSDADHSPQQEVEE